MEKGQIFPGQSHDQETGFEAEEPQPYLEAKLYIERMEQERIQGEICEDGIHGPLPPEGPEPLEHGVSLTVYPIRVPSMHFTCATVQWDVPHTTAEASVDEINCREGACLDWVVNPLSADTPSMSQEDIIDLIPEKEHRQTDTVLPQEPAVTAKNKDNSSQTYHAQDLSENVCITSSNEKDKVPFKDTSQTSAASTDNGPATFGKDFDQSENNVSIKDLEVQFCVENSDVFEEKNKETRGTALEASDEPVQAREKDSNGGNLGGGSPENGQCDYEVAVGSTHHSRTAGHSLEQDYSQETEEPDLMEKSDRAHAPSTADSPEKAEQLVKYAFGARQSIEEVDSERVVPKLKLEISQSEQLEIIGNSEKSQQVIFVATLDMANDEMVQLEPLQHAETFVKLQESMQADRQEERTCSRHVESSAEMELPEDTKQLERPTRMEPSEQESQYNCLDKVECCEQSKHQEISFDKKIIENLKQLECSFEIDPTGGSNESKVMSEIEFSEQSKQSEFSVETEPLEHLNESDISSEELFKQSKQSSDPDNTEQTQSKQSPQLQHIEQQKFKQQQNEDEKPKEMSGQTEQSISHHMRGPQEELERPKSVEPVVPSENGSTEVVDREQARRLAERLYRLENVQRTDVVQHLDKDNDFSRAVGEEYLKFFDFTDQSLDNALRSFLKEVVLIGETQERERVLERFSSRYHQCNPTTFSSAGAVLTLTCAVMLLNTDLHGQNVGKAMSMTDFVSNLNGMNEGKNFSKDLLKTFYNSIKNHQLEWAIEEKYLVKSMNLDPDSDQDASLRSKSNPFQDIAHDKKAAVFQKGFLKRKAHADIDGKRTPWGKRSWKTFYAVLKGMVLYLQKDEYRKDWQSSEEVLSIHHTLAERAQDYTKRPHVFRLQTADWRVFLFEAASTEQMNSWIGRINLVSALYSSPPFPAAVGSQRKFCRPILPATQSALTLEKQLQSHTSSLQSFQEDLSALQQGAPDGRKPKARELEELRHREEYLQHERCRYEAYVQILEVWQTISKSSETASGTDLTLFDQELWKGMPIEEEVYDEIEGGMKRSYSSPSLELEVAPPPMVKVRRNISERRTYRKIVIPRHNKEL